MDDAYRTLLPLYATGCLATVAVCAGTFWLSHRRRWRGRWARPIGLSAFAVYAAAFTWMGWQKAAALNFYVDRATVLEILWRSTHGLGLTTPMSAGYHGSAHWFAAHFTPAILLAYWPVFKVWPAADAIHLAQTVYLMSSAIPVGLFAARRLGRPAGWLFVAAFLCYPTLEYINIYGVSFMELAIPTMAWALYGLETGRVWLLLAASALALMVREDAALVVFGLGVYTGIRGRRALGAGIAIVALAYFFVVVRVVVPSYSGRHDSLFMKNYQSWGTTPSELLQNMFGHPLAAIRHLATAPRFGNAVMYLLPVAFLPLLDPIGLTAAAPNVLLTFSSDAITYHSFNLYYLSPSIPVLFFAAVRGLDRLRARLRLASPLPLVHALLAASVSANIFFGPSPFSIQFWHQRYRVGVFHTNSYYRDQYAPSEAALAARRVAALVPPDAQVSAEQHLLPLLYSRQRLLIFPTIDAGANYVLIQPAKREKAGAHDTFSDFRARPQEFYDRVQRSAEWERVADDHGVILYRKRLR